MTLIEHELKLHKWQIAKAETRIDVHDRLQDGKMVNTH